MTYAQLYNALRNFDFDSIPRGITIDYIGQPIHKGDLITIKADGNMELNANSILPFPSSVEFRLDTVLHYDYDVDAYNRSSWFTEVPNDAHVFIRTTQSLSELRFNYDSLSMLGINGLIANMASNDWLKLAKKDIASDLILRLEDGSKLDVINIMPVSINTSEDGSSSVDLTHEFFFINY